MTDGNPLLSLLRRCVVRIDAGAEFRGTGFFVAPDAILTCAHVVHGVDEVTVSAADGAADARVGARLPDLAPDSAAAHFYPLPDLALLTVTGFPGTQPCAPLDRTAPLAGGEADLLWLTGFCLDSHEPGRVALSSASVEFEGAHHEGEWELFKLKEGQVIGGFSGSPVLNLRTGRVCGVIDSSRDPGSDLGGFAIPAAVVAQSFPELTECDGEDWQGASQEERVVAKRMKGDAQRLPIALPFRDPSTALEAAPSALLRPQFGLVPLTGREGLQSQLMRWRESSRRLGVALITGAGGFGKTRLALEECARAERSGWTAGLLTLDANANVDAKLDELVAWPGRLMVAIDYAETRPSLVGSLILRLAQRTDGPPARLILVCRQARTKSEVQNLFASGDGRDIVVQALDGAEPIRLDDRENAVDSRWIFDAGVAALAKRYDAEVPAGPGPALKESHFARPLFVLGAALLVAREPSLDVDSLGRDELMLKLLDEHEAEYWKRWGETLGVDLDPTLRAQAVAVATLLSAETEEEALSLVNVVPDLQEAPAERRRAIARWLGHLYTGGDLREPPAIAPVEPDLLAEALVTREYTEWPALLGASLDGASDHQLTRAFAVLSRAVGNSQQLADHVREALDRRLPAFVKRASGNAELAAGLNLITKLARPRAGAAAVVEESLRNSFGLGPLAPELFPLTVEHYRALVEEDRDEHLPALAMSLNNLSNVFGELGRASETLRAIEEAVGYYRELVEADRDEHLPILAATLNNLSGALRASGQGTKGLRAIEEAVGYYRELVEGGSQGYVPDLAMSLNHLASAFAGVGDSERSLEAAAEAVGYYRELVEADRDEHLPSLAGALNNFSSALRNLRRNNEGLEAVEEAVGYYRELVEEGSQGYVPDLAMSLNNLSAALGELERGSEGLEAVEEAVGYYRQLVDQGSQGYIPSLAGALNNLSTTFGKLDRSEEALEGIEEAVGYYRELVEEGSQGYVPDLAGSLNNLSNVLEAVGRNEDALAPMEESVEHRRHLAEESPEGYVPELAVSLNNLATRLRHLNRHEDAIEAVEEAVEHRRRLAEMSPDRYLPELAVSLNNFANVLGGLQRTEEALEMTEEAVSYYRELTRQDRERYLRDLALSLNNLGGRLGSAGRVEEVPEPVEEAVGYYRELVEKNPAYLGDLAGSLNNLAGFLLSFDRQDEALKMIAEAIGHRRELVRRSEERYLPELAASLGLLLAILTGLERAAEALEPIDEAIEEYVGSAAVGSLLLVKANWHHQVGDLAAAIQLSWTVLLDSSPGDPAQAASARKLLRALRAQGEDDFDLAWDGEIGEDRPVWLLHPEHDTEAQVLLKQWIQTSTWGESRAVFDANEDAFLSDVSEAALEHLIDANPGHPELGLHLALLKEAREGNVDAAFNRVVEGAEREQRAERLARWGALGADESLDYLLENSDRLLNLESELALVSLALRQPEGTAIFARVALLSLARLSTPEEAYGLLGGPPPPPGGDEGCLMSNEDPSVLALARLYSGLQGESAERQFQHALAAEASGQAEEAGQAIERCRQLLPTWEIKGYLRRLGDLRMAHPQAAAALQGLERKLLRSDSDPSSP